MISHTEWRMILLGIAARLLVVSALAAVFYGLLWWALPYTFLYLDHLSKIPHLTTDTAANIRDNISLIFLQCVSGLGVVVEGVLTLATPVVFFLVVGDKGFWTDW